MEDNRAVKLGPAAVATPRCYACVACADPEAPFSKGLPPRGGGFWLRARLC